MTHSEAIFGKDIYGLTLEDLESFFSEPQEETSILEFKHGDVELDSIYKEISAFLNTDGGVLIIGSPKEQTQVDKSKTKVCQGLLTPSRISNQDKLMHSIASNITPTPATIKAKTISLEKGSAYILEVGKSINPPHQVTNDGRYYLRLERESKPAPHGIIDALFKQRKAFNLYCEIEFTESLIESELWDLVIWIFNDAEYVAENVKGYVSLIGELYSKADKRSTVYVLDKQTLDNGKTILSTTIKFPHPIVLGLNTWHGIFDLAIQSDYFYLVLIYWAEGNKAIKEHFKLSKSTGVRRLNFENDSQSFEEISEWSSKKISFQGTLRL